MSDAKLGVLNIGVTRYPLPLGTTEQKKLERMSALAHWYVVGLSRSFRYQRASEPVELYLLPLVPVAAVRFACVFLASIWIGLRLIYRQKVQVILSQGPYEGLAGFVLGKLARAMGRAVVVVTEVHGEWDESLALYHRLPLSSVLGPILAGWGRFVLRRSDRIRTISGFLEQRIEMVAPDVPRHRFPGYTDFELFGADTEPATSDGPVLAVGGLYRVKGFESLIRAMKQVMSKRADAELHLVGEGPLKPTLREEAARLGIESSLHFLGSLSPRDLRREYERARVFVLPSLSEGLGRVVWEAMASALPVVASNVGGIPELVEHEVTGFLVPPGDEDQLAARISWLLDHPAEAEAMGVRGKRAAGKLYSTEGYVEGYRRLFRAAEDQLSTTS